MEVDDYSSPGFEDDEPSRKKTPSEGVEVTPRFVLLYNYK